MSSKRQKGPISNLAALAWYVLVLAGMTSGAMGDEPADAPAILEQPAPAAADYGQNVMFSVVATGARPLFFQWTHEGSPVLDATNETLTLMAVVTSDGGQYSIVV